jgi:predicted permease
MSQILETLAPLALLIALGSALAHIKFLGATFISDLNKLAFWIALPALIFTSTGQAASGGASIWRLLGVVIAGTLLVSLLAWALTFALRLPGEARGTFVQSAFRGNLAYIAVPVLTTYFSGTNPPAGSGAVATAVVVMVLTMAFYNIWAVVVLQASQHGRQKTSWLRMIRTIATNPLLLSGVLGLIFPLLNLRLPSFLNSALTMLGGAAIPLALLCIGGSLVMAPMRGRTVSIAAASLLKVAVLPALVLVLAHVAGLDPEERRIALVFAACPTAAAAFVMAQQMGGDEALASASIALSTVLSALSLAFALWV